MDARARRRTTDAITLSRIPLAVALVLWRRRPFVVATFGAGALTDVIDGPLARRLGTASERGARLDSAADAVFSAASIAVAVRTIPPMLRPWAARGAAVVAATRCASLAVTRRRFGRWSVMHTRLNKLTGVALTAVGAVALVRGRMPVAALAAAGVVAQAAATEELVIVTTTAVYDPDRPSLRSRPS